MGAFNLVNPYQGQGLGTMAVNPALKSTGTGVGGGAGAGTIASSVISAIGDIAISAINAKRYKNTYEFNAKMAELNARMYKLSANAEIRNIRKKAASLLSSQRAAVAKSGLAMEGSPIEVMMKSQEEAETDVIYAEINRDYGASLYQTQAGIERAKGASTMRDVSTSATKTILSTGGEVYKQYQLKKLYEG